MDTKKKIQQITTSSPKVSCSGEPSNLSGHPLVYLEIDEDKKEINCPYCSKKFILEQ